jgi:hypothetical protein
MAVEGNLQYLVGVQLQGSSVPAPACQLELPRPRRCRLNGTNRGARRRQMKT